MQVESVYSIDNQGNVVFFQSGFLDHNNDSRQFQSMAHIGTDQELQPTTWSIDFS